MAWYPKAIRKELTRNYTRQRRSVTDLIVLHVAASDAASLYGWFSNPKAGASSHFYVRYDGTVEQYIDTEYISWASAAANGRSVSIETAGQASGRWTAAQENALVDLVKWIRSIYPGVPGRLTGSSRRSEKGIGWHSQGVPATRLQKSRGVSQTGGELWSSAVLKQCPGSARIGQIPGIVARATAAPAAPAPARNTNTNTQGKQEDKVEARRLSGGRVSPINAGGHTLLGNDKEVAVSFSNGGGWLYGTASVRGSGFAPGAPVIIRPILQDSGTKRVSPWNPTTFYADSDGNLNATLPFALATRANHWMFFRVESPKSAGQVYFWDVAIFKPVTV